jgi:lysophospholipase L1-like esterase
MNKKNAKLLAVSLAILFILGTVAFFVLTGKNQQSSSSDIIRIACVGDSLTQSSGYPYELWKLLGSNAPYTIGNYSFGPHDQNSTLNDSAHYAVGNFGAGSTTVLLNTETPYMNNSMFQIALQFQPNIIIIMLGTNDAQPNLKQFNESFVGDYVKLVSAFQALASKPKIWVALPPPIFSNQSGKLDSEYFASTVITGIKQAAKETNLPFIDIYSALANYPNYFPDGEHPNDAAAKLIANEIFMTIISQ